MANTIMQWADNAVSAKPYSEDTKRGECARFEEHGVRLIQTGKDRFTVVYGKQVKKDMMYNRAALELGAALMHSLACDGKLDNREKGER